jgi:hypothetical protein
MDWLKKLMDFGKQIGKILEEIETKEIVEPFNSKTHIIGDSISGDLNRKTEALLIRIEKEYQSNPYIDKVNAYHKDDSMCVEYTFENDDKVIFDVYEDSSIFEIRFKPKTGDKYATRSEGGYLFTKVKQLLVVITNKSVSRESNDLKDKYNLIVRKIKLRQEEIQKIDITSPLRESMINELATYKRMADKFKKQLYI